MDGETLVASPLQRSHVLCVLAVAVEWFRHAVPFDQLLDRHGLGVNRSMTS